MKPEHETVAADNDVQGIREFIGPVAAAMAMAIFIGQARFGWLEAAYGGLALLFWAGIALWIVASALAIRARKHWWVIATAPFALYPLAAIAMLSVECAKGNCL